MVKTVGVGQSSHLGAAAPRLNLLTERLELEGKFSLFFPAPLRTFSKGTASLATLVWGVGTGSRVSVWWGGAFSGN